MRFLEIVFSVLTEKVLTEKLPLPHPVATEKISNLERIRLQQRNILYILCMICATLEHSG